MHLHTSLVIGAGLLFGLGAAHADMIDVTFNGQVLDHPEPGVVVDHTGVFGTPGASLVGEAYQARFRFDDRLGTTTVAHGATTLDTPGQALATLTIKGVDYKFTGAWHASMRRESNNLGGDFRVLIYDDASADQGLYLYAISTQDFMGGSIDLRQGFSYSFQPGDVVGQTFNIHNFNNNGFEWARGMLDVQTLTVSSVPEPASALLLAAGLLAFGARRGRHLLS